MKSILPVLILFSFFLWINPAKAIDPATMTSAAPKAVELAAIWSPHAANTLQSCGIGLYNIGEATLNIFYLPLGVVQCTLGAPFGYFGDGVSSLFTGLKAPFLLVYQVILLPVRLVSLGTVK